MSTSSILGAASPSTASSSNTPEIKRRRRTTKQEHAILEHLFQRSKNPCLHDREDVCRAIDMPMKKLQVWLQNRRQKEKKDAEKWKPASYTSDGVKLNNTGTSSPLATGTSNNGGSSVAAATSPLKQEDDNDIDIDCAPAATTSCNHARPQVKLPSLRVITHGEPSSLPARRPSSTIHLTTPLDRPSIPGLVRSYSLPVPPTSAPPSQLTFPPFLSRTTSDPPRSAIGPTFPSTTFSLSATHDGRAIFDKRPPVARTQSARLHLPSLPQALRTSGLQLHPAPTTAAAAQDLWAKLESDPVEPEDADTASPSSPVRRARSIRMEDFLGSAKKNSNNYDKREPFPALALAEPENVQTLVHSSAAPLGAIRASLAAQRTSVPANAASVTYRHKRTISYAIGLHRSMSMDNIHSTTNNNNKENIPPNSYSYSSSASSSSSLLPPGRPGLSRSHSYQDRSSSSSHVHAYRKKQRVLATSSSSSDVDVDIDGSAGEDEPDLTFSTEADTTVSSASTSLRTMLSGGSDAGENDTDATSESEHEHEHEHKLEASAFSALSAGRKHVQNSQQARTPAQGAAIHFLPLLLSPAKKAMSQEERDCAAVLLGFGSVH